jgi:hypothetical protein
MKGAVGTSMSAGNSRKWATKRAVRAIIHAKHLLKLAQTEKIEPEILAACDRAINMPSLLENREKAIIYAEWERWAVTGKLRGIKQ